MRRRRRRRPSLRKRAARRAVALAAALLAVAAVTTAFSCLGGIGPARRDREPLAAIPRDLRAAPPIRVALVTHAPRVTVEVRGPYAILAEGTSRAQFAGEALPPTDILPQPDGALAVGGVLFRPGALRIEPRTPGTLIVDGTAYRGDLACRGVPPAGADRPAAGVLAVNRVNLEEYVAGVVGSEMPLAFPEEALRAQAVASRTYGLYQVRTRPAGALYDLTDDTFSQVYRGLANEKEVARRVTEDTSGVVITWRGSIVPAYFHSTCGGRTIPASFALGDRDIPPLGGAECGFCEDSKYARWEGEIAKAELAERLRREGLAVRAVTTVEALEMGPAGHVATVRVVHPEGELRIRAPRFRLIAGPGLIRATLFTIEDRGDKLLLRGRGWGHGAGLCQMGARGMARAGYGATAILARYYPGGEPLKLY